MRKPVSTSGLLVCMHAHAHVCTYLHTHKPVYMHRAHTHINTFKKTSHTLQMEGGTWWRTWSCPFVSWWQPRQGFPVSRSFSSWPASHPARLRWRACVAHYLSPSSLGSLHPGGLFLTCTVMLGLSRTHCLHPSKRGCLGREPSSWSLSPSPPASSLFIFI